MCDVLSKTQKLNLCRLAIRHRGGQKSSTTHKNKITAVCVSKKMALRHRFEFQSVEALQCTKANNNRRTSRNPNVKEETIFLLSAAPALDELDRDGLFLESLGVLVHIEYAGFLESTPLFYISGIHYEDL